MVVGRAQRRAERETAVIRVFGDERGPIALDLLEVLEFAWHDCFGDVTPPPQVIDDILVCSEGRLELMIRAVRLAVADWRDLRVWAEDLRRR